MKRFVDSGEYRRTLMESGFSFEKSELGAGFVDKVYPDYSKITGRVINGEFIRLKLHKNCGRCNRFLRGKIRPYHGVCSICEPKINK